MASKEARWSPEAHSALCGALAEALIAAGASPAAHKDLIIAHLQAKGFDFTWEGIR